MEYEETIGIGGVIVEFFTRHSWLDLLYVYLVAYVSIPVKQSTSSIFNNMLGDAINAKSLRWGESVFVKLLSPLIPIMMFIMMSLMSILYSLFFCVPFFIIGELIGVSFAWTNIPIGAGLGLFIYLAGISQLADQKIQDLKNS